MRRCRLPTAVLLLVAAAPASADPTDDRAPAENVLACEGGDMGACEQAGRAYRDGEGVTQNAYRAAEYLERACQTGRAEACADQAAVMRSSGDRKLRALSHVAELRACSFGRRASCRAVLAERDLPPPTARTVAARMAKTCEAGDGAACVALGHLTQEGLGTARDARDAVAHFRRACDLNDAFGCLMLGRAFELGRGVKRDRPRAAQLLRRACGLDAFACRAAPRKR